MQVLNYSRLLAVLISLTFLIQANGQNSRIDFQNLSINDGLSHSLITSMTEDDKGFLWIATQNGLNRYDGYEFKKYYAGKSDKTINKNHITKLFRDSFEQLWITYYKGGLNRFNLKTGVFHEYEHDSLNPKSISSDNLSILKPNSEPLFFEDQDLNLWLATDKGINLYNRISDSFSSFQFEINNNNSISNNTITSISEDNFGYLWIGTQDGLNKLEKATGKIKRVLTSSTNPELDKLLISKILPQEDGSVLVGTTNMGLIVIRDGSSDSPVEYTVYIDDFKGINHDPSIIEIFKTSLGKVLLGSNSGLFEFSNNKPKIIIKRIAAIAPTKIININEDSKGFIWVLKEPNPIGDNQLYRFDKHLDSYEIIDKKKSFSNSLNNIPIKFIFNGNNDLIYLGTAKNGFYKININASNFRLINTIPSNGIYITNNDVYSIYEDSKKILWVGTALELNRLDLNKKLTKNFHNTREIKHNISYAYSKKLDASLIGAIAETKDYKFWFGSFDYKISFFNPSSNIFLNFHHNPNDPNSFTNWSNRSIIITKLGETYFGSTSTDIGFCKLNPDGVSFKHYSKLDNNGTNTLSVYKIIEDKSGILWLGTYNDLVSFDPKTEKFIYYSDNKQDPQEKDIYFRTILEPRIHGNNILWLGTNNGLKRFNKNNKTYKSFTTEDGLPNNTIFGILEDEEGFLWLSTLNGLAKFDPVTFKVTNYTKEDGLQSNEFNEGAYFKNNDGIMYFGGVNGITYFNPEDIYNNPHQGDVVLTNLKINQQSINVNDTINGKVILNKVISYTDELMLSQKERLISFEFATSNMVAPNDIQYRYKLDGYEKEWNEVSANQRFANYSDLKSGNYTLVIDSSNGDGVWSDDPLRIKINVSPYFWEKLWFKLAVVFFFLTAIIIYIQWRTRNFKQQKKLLEKEVQERTMELKKTNQDLKNKNNEISEMSKTIHEMDLRKLRFFTNISHEFRTPLTLILNPTEKLIKLNEFKDTGIVKDNLKVIQRNSKRLYKLINQLLELPKIDSGTLKLLVSKGDIITYSQDILDLFKDYAYSKNIKLEFPSKLKDLQVYFDKDKIEKILYNLISNAINYTPSGGKITLSISDKIIDSKKGICISIKDTGSGIPNDQIDYIFDRFYQIENNTESKKISAGIGLSLVKSLVEIYKGKIKVSSEIDKGTEFKVFLPVGKESFEPDEILSNMVIKPTYNYSKSMLSVSEEQEIETPSIESTNNKEIKIVIVEDNKDLNKFLCNELNSEYHVFSAENGKEGLELIKEHLPNIVISDIMMPVMDGITLCKEVKNNIETSHIPVFLLTAKSEQEDQLLGLEGGADDYISKPFNVDSLKLKILNTIAARKILLDKFSNDLNPIPKGINISQIDHNLLKNIKAFVENNIDADISGDMLASELGMSKSNLYKKLNNLTGISVNIFVRNIRLNVAANLFKKGNYNVSEVAYTVGFNNPKYFSSCFMKYYGKSPKSFMKDEN